MSDGLQAALDLLDKMSTAAKAPLETVATILRTEWGYNKSIRDERRSSPEEKEIIEDKVQKLFDDDPTHFDEVSPKEIAREIGVRVNQGNRSRIRHKVKQLQLTYQKAAE